MEFKLALELNEEVILLTTLLAHRKAAMGIPDFGCMRGWQCISMHGTWNVNLHHEEIGLLLCSGVIFQNRRCSNQLQTNKCTSHSHHDEVRFRSNVVAISFSETGNVGSTVN